MATPDISATAATSSPNSSLQFLHPRPPSPRFVRDASAIAAYERYLRLPELSGLCTPGGDFPGWANEPILKPALQALEITFRFISVALSDPRPYSNRREWKRRLESLAAHQIGIVALLCEGEPGCGDDSRAPIADPSAPTGVLLARGRSSQQVWKPNGAANTLVSHTSEASLLPRLVSWAKSEDVASKILMQIECQMRGCPFTLGLGEPNLAGKPSLEYDLVVKPSNLHSLKKSPSNDRLKNQEDQTLLTIHQILECWLFTAKELLKRVGERIDGEEFGEAASDSWLLERIWKLLSELEDLHLLMDPDDFLRLKSQLAIKASSGSEAFCFRSRALLEVANLSKDLKHRVPRILGVEADPNGGPRVQEAAMGLLRSRSRGERGAGDRGYGRIHLLQAFQAVEAAVKKFFFGYRQLMTAVMGSLEANGNRGLGLISAAEPSDSLTQMFMDPPYFPSMDAAKTFLGEMWRCQTTRTSSSSFNGLDNSRCGVRP